MLALILTTFAKSHSPQRKPGQVANRLWAYQLQEEALKEKIDEKVVEHPRSVDSPEAVAAESRKPAKRVVPKKREVVEAPFEIIPFKRKPTSTQPSVHEALSTLEPVAQSFSSFKALSAAMKSSKVVDLRKEQRRRARRRAAAFLLLAA